MINLFHLKTLAVRVGMAILTAGFALLETSCMPASWGAGALLHPARRPVTIAPPVGAEVLAISGDGVILRGWLFQGSGPKRGTIIYLHGSADNRTSGIFIAQRFVTQGFDVLMYDSRAHGESGGGACTYGYYERKDLERVIDLVRSKPVVLIGVSLGAAVALQTAAEDRRIATVIAVATFSDLRTVASGRAPFFASKGNIAAAFRLAEKEANFRIDDVSPVVSATRIRVPVLLIHGQNDKETPPWHSQRVFDALSAEKKLLLVPGAGHNNALQDNVWAQVDAWIDKIVPKASAGA